MAKANADELDFFGKVGFAFGLWSDSWEAFKTNIWTFIALYLIPGVAAFIAMFLVFIPLLFAGNSDVGSILALLFILFAVLAVVVIALAVLPAMVLTQLESIKGKEISVGEAFGNGKKYILRFVVYGLLTYFIIAVPLLLSILLMAVFIGFLLFPFAIAWAAVVGFVLLLTPYIIVSEDLGATDAMQKSYDLTKKHWQWVLAVYIVMIAISVVSSVPLVGWIAGIAGSIVYFCLPALIYTKHIAKKNTVATTPTAASSPVAKAPKAAASKTKK